MNINRLNILRYHIDNMERRSDAARSHHREDSGEADAQGVLHSMSIERIPNTRATAQLRMLYDDRVEAAGLQELDNVEFGHLDDDLDADWAAAVSTHPGVIEHLVALETAVNNVWAARHEGEFRRRNALRAATVASLLTGSTGTTPALTPSGSGGGSGGTSGGRKRKI